MMCFGLTCTCEPSSSFELFCNFQAPGAHSSATKSHWSAQYIMPTLPVAATPQYTVMADGQGKYEST